MKAPIEIPKKKIEEFCKKHQIREFSLFGSVLRGDFRPDSDIDILVDFEPTSRHTLFDVIEMEDELKEIFGRDVDLVEKRAVTQSENYIRRKHILESFEVVYVA